ncbi:hypothetical protein T265_09524 [Opisthorchis viverrini]|uniref:Uncharacterized protein n=1 Tax=Opisthorchis viverrini TaxID=6198 RepID=A0A074Z5K2_OPIVI|nr:hypothetical protein T265_09524 [Opisthorchis viverrini]KER22353.1 hypothetical protein T265_09524 [Opisthorchis viverrini]
MRVHVRVIMGSCRQLLHMHLRHKIMVVWQRVFNGDAGAHDDGKECLSLLTKQTVLRATRIQRHEAPDEQFGEVPTKATVPSD